MNEIAQPSIIEQLLQPGIFFWLMLGAIPITAIVMGCLASIIRSVTRERTRREIAAYIAEGSMTPEQGERLLKARNSEDC
ncbi:MAG: hypothetical protein EA423_03060 [Phycisphaerales bacterium]|nr:MAG: hypothetical protein EA423_03060 [Phycisphaerales bacterium]